MNRTDQLISMSRKSVFEDEVKKIVMLGSTRLTRLESSQANDIRSRIVSVDADKDLSVEHVAILGEN